MVATMQQVAPGSLFGVPGYTRPIETIENNDGQVITLSQTNSTQVAGMVPFQQTDVIRGWWLRETLTNTVTAGTSTVTTSPLFPDNFIGAFKLNFQNQFSAINVESGFDMAIFNRIRPQRLTDYKNDLYAQPTISGYSAQSNLVTANNYAQASTTIKRAYWIPAGIQFDEFWNIADTGQVLSAPIPMFVSPQFMAGTARIVSPSITFNPASAATLDNAPYNIGTGTGTFTGSATLNWKRIGYYQPTMSNGADSPPIANWQYTLMTQRQTLGGVSKAQVKIPLNGQVLSVYVRLFDPSASAGLGAPIDLSNVSECDLVYGSNLYRYQDRPVETQARFEEQHGQILPVGVMAWDLALDPRGRVTNAYALNTLNTSGIQVNLQFTGTLSSTSYAVVGVEALTYVAVGA